jgi:hypothetical protein
MRIAMLASALALGATTAFAAPLPKHKAPEPPAASTTPPRVVVLQPNTDGEIKITVMVNSFVEKITCPPLGAPPIHPKWQQRSTRTQKEMDISVVDGLKVYNTAGKEVPRADALKALAGGGVVLVSEDGKPVNPAFLAKYREGTLVLVAPDLVLEPDSYGPWIWVP